VNSPAREYDQALAQAILAQAADAVIFADPEGVIRIWNAAAARIFGFAAEEALGESLDLIIPDHLRSAHWTGFHRAMQSGTTRLKGHPTLTPPLSSHDRDILASIPCLGIASRSRRHRIGRLDVVCASWRYLAGLAA
jgi:transcriptional regulator with PAS, ATPase and Fis domain